MLAVFREEKFVFRTVTYFIAIVAAGNFIAYKIVHLPERLELVILLTSVLFYPILRRPSIGVYLLFCIMPFVSYIRRLYYLKHMRPSVDPIIAIGDIIIALTLIGLFFVFREKSAEENRVKLINRVVLWYFAYCLLRTFFINILPLRDALMQFHFFGPSVLFFYIGTVYAEKKDLLNRIWIITLVIGIVAAVYGIKQLFLGYSKAEQIWFSSISFTTLFIKGFARPFSFFQSPACFSDYMLISIIGVLIMISRKSTNLTKLCLLFLLPLYFYGALITSVRSNWVGIMLALPLWLFLIQIRGGRNRIAMMIILGIFFILSQLIDFFSYYKVGVGALFSALGKGFNNERLTLLVTERTGAIVNPFEEYSLLSRIALWKYLIILSRDPINMIFGRGPGTINADSIYINYLAQFGYPGAIFIIWFVAVLIKKGFTLMDQSPSADVVSLAKGITLLNIIFSVMNLTGTHIHSFPGDVYFWFWNGVIVKLAAGLQTQVNIDVKT